MIGRFVQFAVLPLALTALVLTGCSSPTADATAPADAAQTPSEPLDLSGEWVQSNPNSPDNYQTATITDSTITVNWIADGGDTEALYWAGTYTAPSDDAESYSLDSANDTAQTANAMLASSDATKTFDYADETISYKVSALGVTTTVELKRE